MSFSYIKIVAAQQQELDLFVLRNKPTLSQILAYQTKYHQAHIPKNHQENRQHKSSASKGEQFLHHFLDDRKRNCQKNKRRNASKGIYSSN
jgi:hypothetical protein